MKNVSEIRPVRPARRMSNQQILDVLNGLEYRQQFIVWYQPLERWGGDRVMRLHGFSLSSAEATAVCADEPLLVRVTQAYKGNNVVILTEPRARFNRRCMPCLWHIEALPRR